MCRGILLQKLLLLLLLMDVNLFVLVEMIRKMAANKVRRALQEKRDAIREFLLSLPLKFVFGRESRSYLFNMLILAQAFLLISVLYIFDKAYAYNASFFFFCFCSIFLFFFAHVDYARMRPFSIEYFLCVGRPQLADLRPIIGDMLAMKIRLTCYYRMRREGI